jgi:hypothetical protein
VRNSDIQIFISYARDDDRPAPDLPETKGFVTFLRDMLVYEFSKLGASRPKIWRDTNRIAQGDQFEIMIEEAIAQSAILLVVLSQVWMARDFCQRELKRFAERWKDEGPEGIRSRIVVVGKRHVDPDKRPSLLQHQQGFEFYSMNDPEDVGFELEFYSRGRIRDPRFETLMEQLAAYLWRKAERLSGGKPEPAAQAAQAAQASPFIGVAAGPKRPPANGRSIYLAKPADDMREPYSRIAKELEGRGYAIVPAIDSELPRDSSALAYIDTALTEAELSIHLVGEKPGFAPDDVKLDRIVKLQLSRAGARVDEAPAPGAVPHRAFRRIVWAPRLIEGSSVPDEAPAERDPLAVLAAFDRQLATDKIEGDTLSKFVDFLVQHLLLSAPSASMPAPIEAADTRLYLCHSEQDAEYVGELAEALQQRQIEIVYPAFEGPERELKNFHREQLTLCDAVALCWAKAPEVWVRAHASELRDPHGLGRTKPFAYRSVVAGPPPGMRKKVKGLFPPREIDFVVDLMDKGRPSPEMLDQLVPGGPDGTS